MKRQAFQLMLISLLTLGSVACGSQKSGNGENHEHNNEHHNHEKHQHEGKKGASGSEDANQKSAYICPMECEGSASEEPGKCPECGMDLVKREKHEKQK